MTWDLSFLLMTASVLSVKGGNDVATSLPHPWLTTNLSAHLLRLECSPPSQAQFRNREVYDLRLFKWNEIENENVSLAFMTSTRMTEPQRGSSTADIAKVSFSGEWVNNYPTSPLTIVMPLTSNDFGTYYCTLEYKMPNNRTYAIFSTKFVVDETYASSSQSQPTRTNNFVVHIEDVHEVKVTWHPPETSKFTEFSMKRLPVDKDGRQIAPGQSLFTRSRSKSFLFEDSGVILDNFRPGKTGMNFTVTLYVDTKYCHPFCRYSCWVPYPRCLGRDARFCACSQAGIPLPAAVTPDERPSQPTTGTPGLPQPTTVTSSLPQPTTACISSLPQHTATDGWKIAFIVLLLVFAAVIVIVFICKCKHAGCFSERKPPQESHEEKSSNKERGNKQVNPVDNSGPTELETGVNPPTIQPPRNPLFSDRNVRDTPTENQTSGEAPGGGTGPSTERSDNEVDDEKQTLLGVEVHPPTDTESPNGEAN